MKKILLALLLALPLFAWAQPGKVLELDESTCTLLAKNSGATYDMWRTGMPLEDLPTATTVTTVINKYMQAVFYQEMREVYHLAPFTDRDGVIRQVYTMCKTGHYDIYK